jgi:hypothetical protein
MTLLDDRPDAIPVKTYDSAPPIAGNRTYNDAYSQASAPITEPPVRYRSDGCVCAPSRAMWWRYPMPGTDETVGIHVLLAWL